MKNIPIATTNTINDLQKRCEQLEQQNAELTAKLNWFEEQFRLSQQRRFGSSSERTIPEQQQLFETNETKGNETKGTVPLVYK
ncbi:transposase [Bacillota bacterium LX-D]|nr:transposase [Bacillota bacterium LX-D]